jgi:hypothetical protein
MLDSGFFVGFGGFWLSGERGRGVKQVYLSEIEGSTKIILF